MSLSQEFVYRHKEVVFEKILRGQLSQFLARAITVSQLLHLLNTYIHIYKHTCTHVCTCRMHVRTCRMYVHTSHIQKQKHVRKLSIFEMNNVSMKTSKSRCVHNNTFSYNSAARATDNCKIMEGSCLRSLPTNPRKT